MTPSSTITTPNCIYDEQRSGVNAVRSGSGRGAVGGQTGAGRGAEIALQANTSEALHEIDGKEAQNVRLEGSKKSASYRHAMHQNNTLA